MINNHVDKKPFGNFGVLIQWLNCQQLTQENSREDDQEEHSVPMTPKGSRRDDQEEHSVPMTPKGSRREDDHSVPMTPK